MTEPRLHHQLPRFYLEGFVSPRDGKLWQFRFPDRHWFESSPPKTARERDYYTTTGGDGEPDQWFDEQLRKVETLVAPILARARDGQLPRTVEDQAALLMFVSTMLFRQPAWHSHIERPLSAQGKMLAREVAGGSRRNPEKFRSDLQKCATTIGDPKIMELTADDLAQMDVVASKAWVFMAAAMAIKHMSFLLSLMSWQLLQSKAPDWFITSDLPVAVVDPNHEGGIYGVGLASPTVQVTMPLARNLALLGFYPQGEQTEPPDRSQYEPWPEEFPECDLVGAVNVRSVRAARRCLLTPDQSAPGCAEIVAAVAKASDIQLRTALGDDPGSWATGRR